MAGQRITDPGFKLLKENIVSVLDEQVRVRHITQGFWLNIVSLSNLLRVMVGKDILHMGRGRN